MNNNNLLIQSWQPFQFLTACHYINNLSLILSNENLISHDEQNQTIPVLNALFLYFKEDSNGIKLKRRLLRKILIGTDLYGGHKNETLDKKYINQTYEYIISKTLFSDYGGIPGYLASRIAMTRNSSLSVIKKQVYFHFSNNYVVLDPCSRGNGNWTLSDWSIKRIFEDYLWSVFPQPEEDMKLLDINYIYAMVGLKIARSVHLSNLNFDDYVQLASSSESLILINGTTSLPVEIFSIPALFYYAHKTGNNFFKHDITALNSTFWDEAYRTFFSYLNKTKHNVLQEFIKESLYFKLENQLAKIMSRAKMAEQLMKQYCKNFPELPLKDFIIKEYLSGKSLCFNYKVPDLNKEYEKQFNGISDTYNKMEKGLVQQALEDADLLDKINSPNTYVYTARLRNKDTWWCFFFCRPEMNKNIFLMFAVVQNEREHFYALKQIGNALVLLNRDENEVRFDREVVNVTDVEPEIPILHDLLKDKHQNATDFIETLAHDRTEKFVGQLREEYRNVTSREKMNSFLLSLVPFYSCVGHIKKGHTGDSILSCSLDVISLIPIVGFTAKYSTIIGRSFILEGGAMALNAVTKSGANQVVLRTGFSEIVQAATRTFSTRVLTKEALRDLSIASIRTLDPGFESSYRVGRFGLNFHKRLFKYILLNQKRFRVSRNLLTQLKATLPLIKQNSRMLNFEGMIPEVVGMFKGHKVTRYRYPLGSNLFGPECLQLFGMRAELRTTGESLEKIPVVPSRVVDKTLVYKKVGIENGHLSDSEYKLDNYDLLIPNKFVNIPKSNIFHALEQNTWSVVKKDRTLMRQLRLKFYDTALLQIDESWLKNPIELCYTEITNKVNLINYLRGMKGKEFFLNDVTLMRKYSSNVLDIKNVDPISLNTKIVYHLKLPSQYGVVNTHRVDPELIDRFLISDAVSFTVSDVKFTNDRKKTLILELEGNPLTKPNWYKYALQRSFLLNSPEPKNPRLSSVENAAETISSKVPGYRLKEATDSLKSYFLKLKPSQSEVPTYDKLSEVFCRDIKIPADFDKWKFTRSEYIDDVLFKTQLDTVKFTEAKQRIYKLYGIFEEKNARFVYDAYDRTPSIREILRFEDYYAIYSELKHPNTLNLDTLNRREFAHYRLALRQSELEWAKESIKVYCEELVMPADFTKYAQFKVKQVIGLKFLRQTFERRQLVINSLNKLRDSRTKPVLFEITLNNQFGVADVNRVIKTRKALHVIPEDMLFVVDSVRWKKINDEYVLVIKIHDFPEPKETKIIRVIRKVENILKTDTKFHV